jgi:hypothetical protein
MNKLPKVNFKTMSLEENINMMAMFIDGENDDIEKKNTEFFKDKYTTLKNIDFTDMSREEIIIILSKIENEWAKEMEPLKEVTNLFQQSWDLINDNVMNDLSNRLNIKWPEDCLDINANLGIMYACPRYISKRQFDADIHADFNRLKMITIHEICHMLYFEKWKELYNDYDEKHYNNPHIIWHLSEAIIDPLLNNETFTKYTNMTIGSYNRFYSTKINDESIIDILRNIMNNNSIEDAIKGSYNFFLENEHIIKK